MLYRLSFIYGRLLKLSKLTQIHVKDARMYKVVKAAVLKMAQSGAFRNMASHLTWGSICTGSGLLGNTHINNT